MTNLDPDRIAQMSLQRGINFRSLAEKMGNCSGAEVRGICTEAGKLNSSGIAFF
jgi:ATP-dependent 26S proteasome regulatory subunit